MHRMEGIYDLEVVARFGGHRLALREGISWNDAVDLLKNVGPDDVIATIRQDGRAILRCNPTGLIFADNRHAKPASDSR